MLERRSFITGLVSLIAAPAIVRAGSLMPVRSMIVEPEPMWIPVGNSQWQDLLAAQREINLRHSEAWIGWARRAVAREQAEALA